MKEEMFITSKVCARYVQNYSVELNAQLQVTWSFVANTELMFLSGIFMCPQEYVRGCSGVANCPGLESWQGQP